jgi:transcriptional regulator with XRE-family HTH domain
VTKSDKAYLEELGRRIAEGRKRCGLTQEELGYRCDMEKPNISRLETGGTNPTVLTLRRICAELNMNIKELFD